MFNWYSLPLLWCDVMLNLSNHNLMSIVQPSFSFRTVFAPFWMFREEKQVIMRLTGLLGAALWRIFHFGPFPVAAHEKLPQNLDPGFLSMIFAFRAKTDDDVSMLGLVQLMTWHGDVNRVTSQYRRVMMWQYGRCDDVTRVTQQEASAGGDVVMVTCCWLDRWWGLRRFTILGAPLLPWSGFGGAVSATAQRVTRGGSTEGILPISRTLTLVLLAHKNDCPP